MRVIAVSDDRILGSDVRAGHPLEVALKGAYSIEMVKRSVRRKPKTGETLTGAEVVKVHWKRGSVIRCTLATCPLVLFADGKWHDVDNLSSYEFDDLAPEAPFEVLLVA